MCVREGLSRGGETGQVAEWRDQGPAGPGVSSSQMPTLLKVRTAVDVGRKVVSKEPLSLVDEKSEQGVRSQGDWGKSSVIWRVRPTVIGPLARWSLGVLAGARPPSSSRFKAFLELGSRLHSLLGRAIGSVERHRFSTGNSGKITSLFFGWSAV